MSLIFNQNQDDLDNTEKLYYRNLYGSVEYSEEDKCWFGKILYTTDIVLYEADSKEKLGDSFKEAVDGYLGMKTKHEL